VPAHSEEPAAFEPAYLRGLKRAILASPYFTAHTLNRDFVGTKGFSVVFRHDARAEVERSFPAFAPFLARVLRPDCNAFYLNPLWLQRGSRVDPHVDRSLRSYCKSVLPPVTVSVLYVAVSPALEGGELVLARGRRVLARVQPVEGTLLHFDGDLTHSVEPLRAAGERLSLVCEQYALEPDESEQIPAFALETRARGYR
jgi:hypothetical protein